MSQPIQSEAHLTTFEAISMIVGNSIGTGIIAVPYLATKNSMLDVVWMVLIAYCVNVILHLIIAELSYIELHLYKETEVKVPIHLKITLTIKEAAEYSNIGINKIDSMLKQPNCPFVLYVGTRKLVKRKEFEEYIRRELII